MITTVTPGSAVGAISGRKILQSSSYKSKKPPVRNITALTHSLNVNLMLRNATTNLGASTPGPKVVDRLLSSANDLNALSSSQTTPFNQQNRPRNLTALNQSSGALIKMAPSYTFYAPKELLLSSAYVLHISREVLEHIQTWLEISYPLTKVDFVALPSLDRPIISSLGLIIVKASFLIDTETITTMQQQQNSLLVAEAIVKQFFGGITSRRMLKDVWLWEGLIKYLSTHILSPLQQNLPLKESYHLNMATVALDIDAIQGWDSIVNGTRHDGNNEEFFIQKVNAQLWISSKP